MTGEAQQVRNTELTRVIDYMYSAAVVHVFDYCFISDIRKLLDAGTMAALFIDSFSANDSRRVEQGAAGWWVGLGGCVLVWVVCWGGVGCVLVEILFTRIRKRGERRPRTHSCVKIQKAFEDKKTMKSGEQNQHVRVAVCARG